MGAKPSYAGAGPLARCPPIDLSLAIVGPKPHVRKGDLRISSCRLTTKDRSQRGFVEARATLGQLSAARFPQGKPPAQHARQVRDDHPGSALTAAPRASHRRAAASPAGTRPPPRPTGTERRRKRTPSKASCSKTRQAAISAIISTSGSIAGAMTPIVEGRFPLLAPGLSLNALSGVGVTPCDFACAASAGAREASPEIFS
jgi:hypothetical protein